MASAREISTIKPEHLYKAIGLAFILAVFYQFLPQVINTLLLVYAAAIVAILLNGLVQPLPLERRWTTGIIGLAIVTVVAALLWFGVPALVSQLRDLSGRVPEFQAYLRQAEQWIRQTTGLNIQLVGPDTQKFFRNIFMDPAGGGGMLARAQGILGALLVPVLILFGGLFAVADPNKHLLSPLLRAVPGDLRPSFRRIFELLGERIMGWLRGVLIGMVAVGLLSFALFYLIGVPNALFLGLFSGLAEAIPLLGPWIGGAVATAVAFLDDPTKGLWTALAALAIQQIENNLIIPWAMSREADIHPFVTLFALVFFGSLFGFLGLLLSIPLVLLIWTVVEVLWVERAIDTDHDWIPDVVEE